MSSIQDYILERTGGDKTRLENFGFKIHSQSDEDGIIEEIFRRVGTTNRTFVEIGVEVGEECNTLKLLEEGWTGLWIEGYPDFNQAIKWNQRIRLATNQLRLADTYVNADNINALIEEAGIRGEIDLFSLDIDSNDYHVFEALRTINPRVIILEHNHCFPPPEKYIMPRNDNYRWNKNAGDFGASLVSLAELAQTKGYTLVGCGLYSPNSFYVRNDLVGDKFTGPFTPERFWNPLIADAIFSYPRTERKNAVALDAYTIEQIEALNQELARTRSELAECRAHLGVETGRLNQELAAQASAYEAELTKKREKLTKLKGKVTAQRDKLSKYRSKLSELKKKSEGRGRGIRGALSKIWGRSR